MKVKAKFKTNLQPKTPNAKGEMGARRSTFTNQRVIAMIDNPLSKKTRQLPTRTSLSKPEEPTTFLQKPMRQSIQDYKKRKHRVRKMIETVMRNYNISYNTLGINYKDLISDNTIKRLINTGTPITKNDFCRVAMNKYKITQEQFNQLIGPMKERGITFEDLKSDETARKLIRRELPIKESDLIRVTDIKRKKENEKKTIYKITE